MNTYLRLLHVTFWMLPLQRWCTVLGLGVLACFGTLLLGPTNLALYCMVYGNAIAFALPALLGGALWRALSAPRAVTLAHGRTRLLFAALGIAITVALSWVACWHLFDLNMPPVYRMRLDGYRELFVAAFALATWMTMASFIASRSPLAMLVVLLVSVGSVYALGELGIESPAVLWKQRWGIALPLALWASFGLWYLRARRISPPGWMLPGGQSIFATVATAETQTTGLAPRAALERLLLGGTSVPRILMQWLLVGGLLLGVLLVLSREGEEEARSVAHMAFAALLLCPAIVAVQSLAIVRRARALWLPSGYSRQQLFSFTERTLFKFALGMALVFTAFLLLLWYTQPWHPTLALLQAVCVLFVSALQLVSHALTRPRGRDFYWRWPALLMLCWFIAWKPLTATDPVSWVGPRGWFWFAMAGVATISFHVMARRRWLVEDLPRVVILR